MCFVRNCKSHTRQNEREVMKTLIKILVIVLIANITLSTIRGQPVIMATVDVNFDAIKPTVMEVMAVLKWQLEELRKINEKLSHER